MSDHWTDQKVNKYKDWRCQFWQAVNRNAELIPDQNFLDDALATSSKQFKHDKTTSVARLELGASKVVLKRYNPRSRGHKIKRAFRRSRARRCWNMSYEFSRAGLNVSIPLLMFEERFGPIRSNAYFANEYLQGEELLSSLPTMIASEQAAVAQAIRKAFDQMHKYKLTHGDMKASNLLWSNGKLFFIDLDAAASHQTSWSWRIAHRKDKNRFLKNWQQHPKILALFNDLL